MVIILPIAADERKYLLKQKLIMFKSNSGQRYGNTLRFPRACAQPPRKRRPLFPCGGIQDVCQFGVATGRRELNRTSFYAFP